jgi:hypothetical protein
MVKKKIHKLQIVYTIEPTVFMCDYQSAIKLSENPIFHDCTKHIVITHHFIKEKIGKKDIEITYLLTYLLR